MIFDLIHLELVLKSFQVTLIISEHQRELHDQLRDIWSKHVIVVLFNRLILPLSRTLEEEDLKREVDDSDDDSGGERKSAQKRDILCSIPLLLFLLSIKP